MTLVNEIMTGKPRQWSKALRKFLMLGVMVIPMQKSPNWIESKFGKLPANKVTYDASNLTIKVDNSASPLFFRLNEPIKVTSVTVGGELLGTPNFSKIPEQWVDDFPLRLGLVEKGEMALSWTQRLFAPSWILELADLDPDGGLKKVHFLNLSLEKAAGTTWTHPEFDFIRETVIAQLQAPGRFELSHEFMVPVETFALWLLSDGDDGKSKFTIKINQIKLNSAP